MVATGADAKMLRNVVAAAGSGVGSPRRAHQIHPDVTSVFGGRMHRLAWCSPALGRMGGNEGALTAAAGEAPPMILAAQLLPVLVPMDSRTPRWGQRFSQALAARHRAPQRHFLAEQLHVGDVAPRHLGAGGDGKPAVHAATSVTVP